MARKSPLPGWAEAAIYTQGAECLRERLEANWHQIKIDVLPGLAKLHNIEKQRVLDYVLWAGKFWQKPAAEDYQDALAKACAELQEIASELNRLAWRLRDLQESKEHENMYLDIPTLWDSVEEAASRYGDWLHIMKGFGHWHTFIDVATRQGAPGPCMYDVLERFAVGIKSGSGVTPTSYIGNALDSRKRNAYPLRVLLYRVCYYQGSPLRQLGLTLSDQAIATLANVMFDLDKPATAESVNSLRARMENGQA